MVKGALAIARSSDRRVPLVRQRTRPGGRVVVGQHDSRPLAPPALGLHPHLRVRLQVADVISLRAVRGHQPEGATGQAVADRGAPADTVRRPVVSSSAKARGAKPCSSRNRHTQLLGRSMVVIVRYLRSAQSLFYRFVAGAGTWTWLCLRVWVSGWSGATKPDTDDQLGRCTAPSGHGS